MSEAPSKTVQLEKERELKLEYSENLSNFYQKLIRQVIKTDEYNIELNNYFKFLILVLLNIVYALYAPMDDCDEVYNYWEPVHYLLKGFGFQTWEYAPIYALRSYLFAYIFYLASWIVSLFTANKILIFYGVRVAIGLFSSIAQYSFYTAVARYIHPRLGTFLYLFMLGGSGLFISTSALLPNTFSMIMVFFCTSKWIRQRFHPMIILASLMVVIAWPFGVFSLILPLLIMVECGITNGPISNEQFESSKARKIDEKEVKISYSVTFHWLNPWKIFVTAVFVSTYILLPSIYFDYIYYGKLTFSFFNLIFYNIVKPQGAGPELYGVAPFSFYFANLTLNFNFAFVLSLLALPLAVIARKFTSKSSVFSGISFYDALLYRTITFYLCLFIFSIQAHKEERFLFILYPLLLFNAATTLFLAETLVYSSKGFLNSNIVKSALRLGIVVLYLMYICISISRNISLHSNFNAPRQLFGVLYNDLDPAEDTVICIGKEWYRFPGSFFLNDNARLAFLKSDFNGLLPSVYEEAEIQGQRYTFNYIGKVNVFNREELDRYSNRDICEYYVDLAPKVSIPVKSNISEFDMDDLNTDFTVVKCFPFLDTLTSPFPYRSFYIPQYAASLIKLRQYKEY